MEALVAIKTGKIKEFIDILIFVNKIMNSKWRIIGGEMGLPATRMLIFKLLALPFGETEPE